LPARCCQPAVAAGVIYADLWSELSTHLAPQALFTQSSPVRQPLLQAFSFPSTLGEMTLHPISQAGVFIYSSHGRWVFPPLLWSFPPSATLTSFSAPGCCVCALAPARASLARPSLFVYSSWKDSPPHSLLLRVPHPLHNVSLLFLLLITQFLFFPRVEVDLSRGLGFSGPGLSVGVPCTTKLTLSASCQAIWVQATGGPGALLVSPFNVKWRFSAPAGGVEGSKFCLFSVVLPARCVSSIFPRFHYRSHAFCFLPLAAILEF
jgi:hypothetical protein